MKKQQGGEAPATEPASVDFIREIIINDNKTGKHKGRVATRFPPEPNGYLHIGHAKSICLNFGIAADFKGTCNLRMDDTNPCKEEIEFVESIRADVRWLGFEWNGREYFASDYFEQLYQHGRELIQKGKAYICDLTPAQMREYRGTLTEPGRESPGRQRSIADNLRIFEEMRAGKHPDGAYTLRAKIDMASSNLNMRDPAMYRIRHEVHHRTGDAWPMYPMYDYAHCVSDSIEGITHSICTLEFEDHRPLYDWYLDEIGRECHPQQIEFARLNLNFTVLSKRKLTKLVTEGHVNGWDDPRMPTIAGYRRRGYSAAAIRAFCSKIGVAKADNIVDVALLNFCLREDLNAHAPRVMAVIDPLKVVIENYPEDKTEEFEAENNPEDPAAGTRKVPFSRELYIEREDFMENPPKGFFRLAPGQEVRLKHAYYITCHEVRRDPATGTISELRCKYDPESRGGGTPDGRKVKGTLHWVSARHARDAEVRLYDHLFVKENPDDCEPGKDFLSNLNPNSVIIQQGKIEPGLAQAAPGQAFQFLRLGYFCADLRDHNSKTPVFNRSTTLRDTWARVQRNQ